jgi:ionotropic glutamate receptor
VHCHPFRSLLLLLLLPSITEAAKKEYFERNFAWHAITEASQDLTANIDNATIMFIRPAPDSKSKDRLGTMKTTYNLKVRH